MTWRSAGSGGDCPCCLSATWHPIAANELICPLYVRKRFDCWVAVSGKINLLCFGDSCKWGYLILVLVAGLSEATSKQPTATASTLVTAARYLTVITWFTYPVVYLVKNVGLAGATATMYEQLGYSVADVTAKAVFGVLIWAIAAEKSKFEEDGKLLPNWSGEVGRS